MWIFASLLAALANAFWVALSQRLVRSMPSVRFTVFFHALLSLWLLPDFLWACSRAGLHGLLALPLLFWIAVILVGACQTLGVWIQGFGIRHDYYTTFAVGNSSPALVLVFAPAATRLIPGFPVENWGWGTVPGTLLVVAGVLLLVRGALHRAALLWGLLVAAVMAVMSLSIRWGTAGFRSPENDAWIVHLFTWPSMVIGTALLVPLMLRHWRPPADRTPQDRRQLWRVLLGASLLGALSTLLFNLAFLWAPSAAQPAALVRINLLFGFLLSHWLLRERGASVLRLVSGAFIALGCLLVVT